MSLLLLLLQVTVNIDAAQDVHSISPLIYGMNYPDPAHISAGHISVARWGGNSTSRYNYQIDMYNTGNDYYFENLPGCWSQASNYCSPQPADPMNNSGANAFISQMMSAGVVQLFTVPTIGFVAKSPPVYAHPFVCGCPRSFNANQDSYDPYDTGCGNCQQGGAYITPPAPTQTSVAIDPTWDHDWVAYLTNRFGASNGQRIYALDNEPALWSSTHHDIRPQRLSYDELWMRMQTFAAAILQADPTARIAGPAEWGWPNYFCSDADMIQNGCSASSPDRAAHGGEELMAWLLDQAHAYEQAHGQRILHYLDLHYYPQGGNPPDIVRSLYDPNYTDASWINDKIKLVPRMRDWVAQHYPGTKISVSEYDFYHHDEVVGAVTYAEVLGVFGREGLDMATAWSPPAPTEKAFGAFVLYRNFDGQGGHFGDSNARATVTGSGVAAFAATDNEQMTVALINETGAATNVSVSLANFQPRGTASYFTGNSPTITRQADVAVSSNQLMVSVPATSFAMVAIPRLTPIDGGVTDAPAGTGGSGTGGTGGTNGAGSTESGCGCRVGGASEPAPLGMLVGVGVGIAAVFLLGRRRQRRR
jgi:MYXO-CTERM domain-containing protein